MDSTPVHEAANHDLLRVIPLTAERIIEVGCSSGALAREYKKINPRAHYVGIDIAREFETLAARHCDRVEIVDIETIPDGEFGTRFDADCWIFGDSLEHLRDPWRVLRNVRRSLRAYGCVVMCVPNMQHWSIQARLCAGLFRYESSGLLDRTHLRFFTHATLLETVRDCGFIVAEEFRRIFDEPQRDAFLPYIRATARALGIDSERAVNDALALQYVLCVVPDPSYDPAITPPPKHTSPS